MMFDNLVLPQHIDIPSDTCMLSPVKYVSPGIYNNVVVIDANAFHPSILLNMNLSDSFN